VKKKKKTKKIDEALKKEIDEFVSGEETEPCKSCGGPVKTEKVNLEHYEGGKLYIIEKVPGLVCENCGETWVPKPFMDEFKAMIETAKSRKKKKRKKG